LGDGGLLDLAAELAEHGGVIDVVLVVVVVVLVELGLLLLLMVVIVLDW